jgi:predicted MPP superfamily phosphohydrolase
MPAEAKEPELVLAVMSDIHAFDTLDADSKTPPSHVCTTAPEDEPLRNPFSGLSKLIQQEKLRSDVLVCCGDMADKARPAGIKYVWDKLQHLRQELGARFLAATPGNHDVDSRYKYNDFDAKGVLQALVPPFPLGDDIQRDKFWSRNFLIHTEDEFRIVILNSSAYHGQKDGEYHHGRVAQRTVDKLTAELDAMCAAEPRSVNILLCHHHPHRYGDIGGEDYSEMMGGHALLELLGSGNHGHWLVIHGHKHQPRICYAAGGASAPVIFSAGSFAATLYPELQTRVRNQFYVITIPWQQFGKLNMGIAGTFRAWDWLQGLGWLPAGNHSGLPPYGGFGYRGDITSLADNVEGVWRGSGGPWLKWSDVSDGVPAIKHLLPGDLRQLREKLQTRHGLKVLEEEGQPAQLGKFLA